MTKTDRRKLHHLEAWGNAENLTPAMMRWAWLNNGADSVDIPENSFEHIDCVVGQMGRRFHLEDDARADLRSILNATLTFAAKSGAWDPERSSFATFLSKKVDYALLGWKDEQFQKKPCPDESDEEFRQRVASEQARDRGILYPPSRYGTVGKMMRQIDWNLALATLEEDELALLKAYVYGNAPLKEAGRSLGYTDYATLGLYKEICKKLARAYNRRLKRDSNQNSSGR